MGKLSLKLIEIARILDCSDTSSQWTDWKWQMKHAIPDVSIIPNTTSHTGRKCDV